MNSLSRIKINKKEERQNALAYGKNISKLTNALNRIDLKIEESEDALVRIKQRDRALDFEIKGLKKKPLLWNWK